MREFNYKALFLAVSRPFPKSEEERVVILRSSCLAEAAQAFVFNMQRISTFASMPAEIAFGVRRDQLLSDCATFNTTGTLKPNLRQFLDGDEPSEKYKAEFSRLARTHTAIPLEERLDLTEGLGVGYIERMLDASEPMQKSMDATYEALVLQLWTAFETLCPDLWYAALDNGPSIWRTNVLRKHPEFKRGSNWEPTSVLPAVLTDPQEKFGSSLRDLNAIGFQTFRLIKFWYETAFGESASRIILGEGGYIRALAAVRNLIVHKAGKADATYVHEVRKFSELNKVNETESIQLEGVLINKLREATVTVGRGLIMHLDDALASHFERP